MCLLSIKVPIRKKSGNSFNDPRTCVYIYIYIYILLAYFIEDQRQRFEVELICIFSGLRF